MTSRGVKRRNPSGDELVSEDKLTTVTSRSGRVRKKSAKLLELEQASKPNMGGDGDCVVIEDSKVNVMEEPAPLFCIAAHQDEVISPAEEISPKPAATKFGRVRKKTAKLLESEEIEELEKKQTGSKKSSTPAPKKGKVKAETLQAPITPQQLIISSTYSLADTTPSAVRGAKTVRQLLASQSEAKTAKSKKQISELEQHLTVDPVSTEPTEGSLKLKFHLGANPSVETPLVTSPPEAKKPKKRKAKSQSAVAEEDNKDNIQRSVAGAGVESDLTFKLILPASEIKVEEPEKLGLSSTMDIKTEFKRESDVECIKEEKPSKKKKKRKQDLEDIKPSLLAKALLEVPDPTEESELVIVEADQQQQKKKSKKKKSESTEDLQGFSEDSTSVYADSQVKALLVKTSTERKVGRKKKEKLRKDGKPKKKRIATAYTMFCSSKRGEVLAEHPGCDFAEISRRLAEKWQSTPNKEKILWKRKARRLATRTQKALEKGLTISTKPAPRQPQSTKLKSGMSKATVAQLAPSLRPAAATMPVQAAAATSAQVLAEDRPAATGTSPIDVAAHFKLLGESLSIIGFRLQQHQGPIAIQGTMSVLLDSLLCALGPLAALTQHIYEIEGASEEVHAKTLDNIAYFMPGIG